MQEISGYAGIRTGASFGNQIGGNLDSMDIGLVPSEKARRVKAKTVVSHMVARTKVMAVVAIPKAIAKASAAMVKASRRYAKCLQKV